ncbi:MAG: phytoene desaturase family protein [Candidatus Thorarchaeota archaeon]
MSKKIIIIGSGISGLASGCYLQMNDYRTEIFELHDKTGGLCTAWKRKEYTFDGCIHMLIGSDPKSNFYDVWQELNTFDNIEFVYHEEFYQIIDGDEKFTFFYNREKLRSEMLRIAPEDEKAIISFFSDLESMSGFSLPIEKPAELFKLRDILGMMFKQGKQMQLLRKFTKQTWGSYLKKFTNEKLRRYISLGIPSENFVAFAGLMNIVWLKEKVAGYPLGGSLPIVRNMTSSYLKYGGKINYNSRVVEILVEDNKAVGIKLENGEEHHADIIISAADGYNTIYELLKGNYISPEIDNHYKELEIYEPLCQISFGVNRKFEEIPHTIFYLLKEEITIDPKTTVDFLPIWIYNFDPTLAPEGKTVVTLFLTARDFKFWQNLRTNDRAKYNKEKERLVNITLEILEKLFPGIRDKVEIHDVATPATYYRYTNNWQGCFEGWILTPAIYNKMKRTLPGLESFYMVSQWVNPGGSLQTALLAGRNVTQIICHEDKKVFTTKQ